MRSVTALRFRVPSHHSQSLNLRYGPIFGQVFVSLAYRHKQPMGSPVLGMLGSVAGAFLMSSVLYGR